MKQTKDCCICLENKQNLKTIVTCKHQVCKSCYKKIDKCPICRELTHSELTPKDYKTFAELTSDVDHVLYGSLEYNCTCFENRREEIKDEFFMVNYFLIKSQKAYNVNYRRYLDKMNELNRLMESYHNTLEKRMEDSDLDSDIDSDLDSDCDLTDSDAGN